LPSEVQVVPLDFFASAGHAGLLPLHTSWRSHSPAAARHTVPLVERTSDGQVADDPLQVSAGSQPPADARQVWPEARN